MILRERLVVALIVLRVNGTLFLHRRVALLLPHVLSLGAPNGEYPPWMPPVPGPAACPAHVF